MRRLREARDQRALHLAVVREDHERLARRDEVLDPCDRRAQLALRGKPTQVVQTGELLAAQRRGDPGLQRPEVQRLGAQPRDDILLGEAILDRVVELDGDAREALGRQLGQDIGLRAAHVAVRTQVPVQPVERLRTAKAPPETGAAAEVPEATDQP